MMSSPTYQESRMVNNNLWSSTWNLIDLNNNNLGKINGRSCEDAYIALSRIEKYYKKSIFVKRLVLLGDGHGGSNKLDICNNLNKLDNSEYETHILSTVINGSVFSDNTIIKPLITYVTKQIEKKNIRKGEICKAIKKAVYKFDKDCYKSKKVFAGTTVAFILTISINKVDEYYCAWLGDSKILITYEKTILFESIDHNANILEEKQRVRLAGGYINRFKYVQVCNNHRCKTAECLGMTRSLGDYKNTKFKSFRGSPNKYNDGFPLQIVSSVPSVEKFNVPTNVKIDDILLTITSDGIMPSKELSPIKNTQMLVDYIYNIKLENTENTGIAQKIVTNIRNQQIMLFEQKGVDIDLIDDITLILIKMTNL